jgi:cytochrome P450/4-hydroxybenzoate polyprenyltransferase
MSIPSAWVRTRVPCDFRKLLLAFRDFVRWREWYYSKIPLFFVGMVYATLRMQQPGATQAAQMGALLVVLCMYAAFGHIVNDYADREIDRAVGKKKLLATWSERAALIAVAIPCIGIVAIALACFDATASAMTIIAVLLAALYSLRPVRLKERGVLGWGAATLTQRTLPLVIIFAALKAWDVVAGALTVLSTVIGLRWIIVHQLGDRENDRRSGVHTVATEQDPQRLVALSHVLFSVEFVCACGVLAMMSYFAPPVGVAALAYAAGLGAAGLGGKPSPPVTYSEYNNFYCVIWPITLAAMLPSRDPVFFSVLFVAFTLVPPNVWSKFRAAFAEIMQAATQHKKFSTFLHAAPRASGSAVRSTTKVQIDKANPYPEYARLRGMGPVLRLDWGGVGPTGIVLSHREAITAFSDSRFVRNADNLAAATGGEPRQKPGFEPPNHTKICKLVEGAFGSPILQRLHGWTEQVADQILNRANSRGEIELISEYASVIPVKVVANLLGLPIVDFNKFRTFIYALGIDHMLDRRSSEVEPARSSFRTCLHALFTARRETPQNDLLTSLVHMEQDGHRLSPEEFIGIVHSLLLGGPLTTNLIGNGMLALLRHPEQLELLRQNPRLADTAVEELLRFDSPLELSGICLPSTDVELGSMRIPGGTPIRVLIPSANRDERQFPAPDTLDITRTPCPHLSFGEGIYYSLAAPLVRLESKIAINMVIERAPNLRLGDPREIKWGSHPILRGLQQLPLRF